MIKWLILITIQTMEKICGKTVPIARTQEKELAGQEEQIEGRISVGCGETASVRLLLELFRTFIPKYPRVNFDIFTATADLVKDHMDKGLPDLGLLLEPIDMEKYDYVRMDIIER